ncbi:glycosyl transferase, partial [Nguyenibacter vanlangensis]|nr:glycosyl transferase [Nguyenibacter vanlangensis]
IETVLADAGRRAAMGRHARAFVADRFDLHRQTRLLEDWYDRLIAEHAAGATATTTTGHGAA